MLRITLPTASRSGLFILEGRLTGLWAKELLRVARTANRGYDNIFDIQEVFYVDSEGEQALRWLGSRGAQFITESAYGKDLCHRLKLDRVEGSVTEKDGRTRPECLRQFRHCHTSNAGTFETFSAADANQHPSTCRG